jgi:hypothetical protein
MQIQMVAEYRLFLRSGKDDFLEFGRNLGATNRDTSKGRPLEDGRIAGQGLSYAKVRLHRRRCVDRGYGYLVVKPVLAAGAGKGSPRG